MEEQNDSKTVRAGAATYFFDLKKTKEEKSYLVITSSRFKGDGEERERSSIVVFPEHAQDFLGAVKKMIEKLDIKPTN